MRRALFAAVLCAPRILRLAYPRAYILDAPYLDAAARIARGQRPYRDFVHPQTPLPEYLVGGLERVLGTTSHRIAETVTALVVLTATLLLWRLVARRMGETAGAIAAVLFAWHPYFLLVHVWLREAWVVAAALGCALAPPWAVALIAAAGFSCKPTFGLFALALLFANRRAGLWALAGCAAAFGVCLVAFGRPFWIDAFVFHLLKGKSHGIVDVLELSPVLLPAAILSLLVVRDRLFVAWLAIEVVFLWFLSPTVWEHNLVELVPPAAACVAAGIMWLRDRPLPLQAALAGGFALVLGIAVRVQNRHDWTGLDGVPRADLRDIAARLRGLSKPDEPVIAPLEVAAEAGRLTPIHYPELEGLVRAAARAPSIRELARETRALPFQELHARYHGEWRPELERALDEGRIRAAVIDEYQRATPLRALQTLDVSPVDLFARGFEAAAKTGRYDLLVRR